MTHAVTHAVTHLSSDGGVTWQSPFLLNKPFIFFFLTFFIYVCVCDVWNMAVSA